ncbi:hypothetical protein K440DRAFT_622487 [Wilcoxina mikolae CBS 423.85]|nr:hypothetical protein K440DRAFT_622487 [Wilcoxina mikolae CBS 423.85]
MHFHLIIAALAAVGTASPIGSINAERAEVQGNTFSRRSLLSPETLEQCKSAPNCETYETHYGTMIRFKPGMEPGTEVHKRFLSSSEGDALSKRDDTDNTRVTVGDGTVNYGSTGASGVGGAIHHLYDTCHEGSCDRSAFEVSTQIVASQHESVGEYKVLLHPDGQYNGWSERGVFVEAMVAVANQGEKCDNIDWANGGGFGNWASNNGGTVRQCTQTNFISVNRFSKEGYLKGFMSVLVELQSPGSGWCGTAAALGGAISSAVGAVPATAVGGALGSGFFGIISVLCSA